jgi:hypothetical protein
MGFDGMFFGKFDYQDHDKRIATKTMELLWKGSVNLGKYTYRCINYKLVLIYDSVVSFQVVRVGCLPVFCLEFTVHLRGSALTYPARMNQLWSVSLTSLIYLMT